MVLKPPSAPKKRKPEMGLFSGYATRFTCCTASLGSTVVSDVSKDDCETAQDRRPISAGHSGGTPDIANLSSFGIRRTTQLLQPPASSLEFVVRHISK